MRRVFIINHKTSTIMKKTIFTLLLALAGSLWTMSHAYCLVPYMPLDSAYVLVTGTIQTVAYPCEEGEPCPTCMTSALQTDNKLYYLTTQKDDFASQLEALPASQSITVGGTIFAQGNYEFFFVEYLVVNYVRPQSLCEGWNVLHEPLSEDELLYTDVFHLTKDTLIGEQRYAMLQSTNGGQSIDHYEGALREGDNAEIYFVPAGSTNEYLLYAFNAQVGDKLSNVWAGGRMEDESCPNGYNATILTISGDSPKQFIVEIEVENGENQQIFWTEGVGLEDGPIGSLGRNMCQTQSENGIFTLLCAYNNGTQVYASDKSKEYGCAYSGYGKPYILPTDTIPLISYIGDSPGSSTVDPVDPNQVVASLHDDKLIIWERSGDEIALSLSQTSNSLTSAKNQAKRQNQTFSNKVQIQISEEGSYTLQLTNPNWNYIIYGTFSYTAEGAAFESVSVPVHSAEKVFRDGQLLIRQDDKLYTPTGIQIQ